MRGACWASSEVEKSESHKGQCKALHARTNSQTSSSSPS